MINPRENWRLGSESIEYVQPSQFEKYLGAKIDPWLGVGGLSLKDKLTKWCDSLCRAPLKPAPKLMILQTYILPRLFYNLLLVEPAFSILN